MCRYPVICLFAAIACLYPQLGQLQRSHGPGRFRLDPKHAQPILKTTYVVTYNTSSTEDVSTECGRYYATEFLQKFLNQPSLDQLNKFCSSYNIKPQIHSVARVLIMESQIEMNTYLNISGVTREAAIKCSTTLKTEFETLQNINGSFRSIEAKGDCAAAQMATEELQFKFCQWKCFFDGWTFTDAEYVNNCSQASLSEPVVWECRPPCSDFIGPCFEPDTKRAKCAQIQLVKKCLSDQKHDYSVMFDGCWPLTKELFENFTADERNKPGQGAGCVDDIDDLVPTTTTTVTPTQPPTTPATSPTPTGFGWKIELLEIDGVPVVGEPPILTLIEGGPTKSIAFSVLVNNSVCAGVSNCNLSVEIHFSHKDDPLIRCRKGGTKSISQIVIGEPSGLAIQINKDNFCRLGLDRSSTQLTIGHSPVNITVPLRARIDGKYDGTQELIVILGLSRTTGGGAAMAEELTKFKVRVTDMDRKATCKSINDPHITSFDGLEYDVFSHGEYVLYRSKDRLYQVNAVFQACSATVKASCNCAVAVKSGDDTIVVDRCRRRKLPFNRLFGVDRDVTIMDVSSIVNNQLTPGTRIFQKDDGKKIYIYLPTGAFVKVIVSFDLINVWLVPSTADFNQTEGLCGSFNMERADDTTLPNGTVVDQEVIEAARMGRRAQARVYGEAWRVIDDSNSLLQGVEASATPHVPSRYCLCEMDNPGCGVSLDVETCDIYTGIDVTGMYSQDRRVFADRSPGLSPESSRRRRRRRKKRQTTTIVNAIRNIDPIDVDTNFKPPVYKWDPAENEALAKDFCETFIRDFPVGKLCAMIPNVDFEQEIRTCQEDIKITKTQDWADSARDALKEQCIEELQKNGSIPNDLANRINGMICINDCSQQGICVQGTCQCEAGYTTADCSVAVDQPPYTSNIQERGLCDQQFFDCSRVRVFGEDFINSAALSCILQRVMITEISYIPLPNVSYELAVFINFNTVECGVPEIRPYLISVSNDGNASSDPLLFIPYNSICSTCSTNTTNCIKNPASCVIDEVCYREGSTTTSDQCLICSSRRSEDEWTTVPETECGDFPLKMKDWTVAVIGAVVGSIVGVLFGVLLYYLCCKSRKTLDDSDVRRRRREAHESFEPAVTDESMLHRNRGVAAFSVPDILNDRYNREPYFQNDGRGVENGVDETTYF